MSMAGRHRALLLAVALLLSAAPGSDAKGSYREHTGRVVPGKYIVSLKPDCMTADLSSEEGIKAHAEKVRERVSPRWRVKETYKGIRAFMVDGAGESDAFERLKAQECVSSVEPDQVVNVAAFIHADAPAHLRRRRTQFIAGYQEVPPGVEWMLNGQSTPTGVNCDVLKSVAWVVDTGIQRDHPELNVLPYTGGRGSISFVAGWDGVEVPGAYDDENGHGTHIAGIIGARDNEEGVVGVCPNAKLAAVRVIDANGAGSISSLLRGLTHVYTYGALGDVANISLTTGISDALDQMVGALAARGIRCSVAAGNYGSLANYYSPSREGGISKYDSIYTVSAVDTSTPYLPPIGAAFSNADPSTCLYSRCYVEFAAPGVNVYSTYINGGYAYLSGTSMAAPHLAGLMLRLGGLFLNRLDASRTSYSDGGRLYGTLAQIVR